MHVIIIGVVDSNFMIHHLSDLDNKIIGADPDKNVLEKTLALVLIDIIHLEMYMLAGSIRRIRGIFPGMSLLG
jgi:hypothetical protein